MKKVIFSAMALMAGSLAFAQVSNDASAPSTQEATNLAGPGSTAVDHVQAGVENYMLVRQEGTSSSVYIDQSGGGLGTGNSIYVRQSGDVNDNQALSGEDNDATVRQAGFSNQGFVRQEGDGNDAAMTQTSTVDNSIGYIRQGTGENAEDNYAGLVQSGGTNNSGWIQQTFDNSEALTLQDGSNHQALTNQNANPDNSGGHNARVEQNGDGQMSYVAQTGTGSDADVLQNGSNNYSDVQQTGGGASVTANNTADVDQDGNLNKSFVNQTNRENSAVVDQLGNRNKSDVVQSGIGANDGMVIQNGNRNYVSQNQVNGVSGSTSNVALVNQGDRTNAQTLSNNLPLFLETDAILTTQGGGVPADGTNDNVAFQIQDGSGNNAEAQQFSALDSPFAGYSKQIQSGDNNTALVVQNAFEETGTPNTNNAALQMQTGDDNIAGLVQSGSGHDAWMIQDGDDKALAVQSGVRNDLVTKQYEGANFMEIGQQGFENEVYAAQRGGQSFIGDQSGTHNVMEVLQVGPGGNLLETIDCNIPAEMAPMDLPNMQGLEIPDISVPGLCADC